MAAQGESNFKVVRKFNMPLLIRDSGGVEQLVLPWQCRQLVLEECHASALALHPGVRRTLQLLSRRVWWPRMRQDVSQYVQNCSICNRVKDSTQRPPGEM